MIQWYRLEYRDGTVSRWFKCKCAEYQMLDLIVAGWEFDKECEGNGSVAIGEGERLSQIRPNGRVQEDGLGRLLLDRCDGTAPKVLRGAK